MYGQRERSPWGPPAGSTSCVHVPHGAGGVLRMRLWGPWGPRPAWGEQPQCACTGRAVQVRGMYGACVIGVHGVFVLRTRCKRRAVYGYKGMHGRVGVRHTCLRAIAFAVPARTQQPRRHIRYHTQSDAPAPTWMVIVNLV